ncbi:MAG: hypothetical protein ACE5JQ_00510 [Candidatus Methylomirabilales bacterium]
MAEKAKGGRGLAFLALLISIVALVIAVMAFQRTGADLQLQQSIESLRKETANMLDRVEQVLRGSKEEQR